MQPRKLCKAWLLSKVIFGVFKARPVDSVLYKVMDIPRLFSSRHNFLVFFYIYIFKGLSYFFSLRNIIVFIEESSSCHCIYVVCVCG